MGGGLMELVAYGAQDVYLTGRPQITFFKVVYRRHTNFSVEVMEHSLTNIGFGKKPQVTVQRHGDLATKMYLKVELAAKEGATEWAYVTKLGHALISSVELLIGGSRIDKHYGVWMDIWYELSHATGQETGYNKMIGNVSDLTDMATSHGAYTLYVPLQFWFCRNTGLALPLIALQYHEVIVQFEFATAASLIRYKKATSSSSAPVTISMDNASLLVDYVYLDAEERRKFAQVGHEYLIDQLQHTGTASASDTTSKYRLDFNHPNRELVWAVRAGKYQGNTFLAETVDEAAKELVKARYVIKTAAGTAPAGWTAVNSGSGLTGSESHLIVDDDVTSGSSVYFAPDSVARFGVASDGDLTSAANLHTKIRYSTSIVVGDTITVTSVDHTLTIADLSGTNSTVGSSLDGRGTDTTGVTYGSQNGGGVMVNQYDNYGTHIDGSVNPVSTVLIQFNGHDRFDRQEGDYFNYVQPWQHHTNTPPDGVNVYSFAFSPEQHQPTGTANLSRIDNTLLNVTYNAGFAAADNVAYIFGCNINVLRIMSGMAGLAYAN